MFERITVAEENVLSNRQCSNRIWFWSGRIKAEFAALLFAWTYQLNMLQECYNYVWIEDTCGVESGLLWSNNLTYAGDSKISFVAWTDYQLNTC